MRKDFSPEEKLLRLIRGSKKKETAKREGGVEAQSSEQMAQTGKLPVRRGEVEAKAARAVSLPFTLRDFNLRPVNVVLIIILAGLLVYFVYEVFYTSYHKEADIFAESEKVTEIEEEDSLEIKPYSFYSSAIEGRNIFMPQQLEVEEVITGPSLEEITADLSLIGIIAGERPQAIIEEKKSGKSYFLYKGGSVGKAKIVEILEDSVVMEYQGEKFELVL